MIHQQLMIAPRHRLEQRRLAVLRELALLDTPAEAAFDLSTRLVSNALGMPIALVSLVDAERQWFKSAVGMAVAQTSCAHGFCAHVVGNESMLVVSDALADRRFAAESYVTGSPFVRFYAGAPVMVDGLPMGALCVADTAPRQLDATGRQILLDTAALIGVDLAKRLANQRQDAAELIAQTGADRRCDWQWETNARGELSRIEGDIAQTTGLPASAFLGRRLHDAAGGDPARFAAEWDAIAAAQRDGRHWRGLPVAWRTAEGALTVTLDALPMHDAHGRHIGHRGTATDLDRPARAIDEARRAEAASRDRTDFLSRISHEMRTPLNAIIGFSRLLLDARGQRADGGSRDLADDLLHDGIDHIQAAGLHLLRLVDDVLDLQKVERDGVPVALERVALDACVREAAGLYVPDANNHGIRIEVDTASLRGLAVHADRHRLNRVLLNLVSNALKYGASGSVITLRGEAGREAHSVHVADQGSGLSAQRLGRLLEPFEPPGRETPVIPGSGLGLVTSRQLAQSMGGTLTAVGGPGRGATFSLTLPAAPWEASPVAAEPAPAGCGAEPQVGAGQDALVSVVYVEDNPVNAVLFEAVIAFHGPWSVQVVPDGAAALELLKTHTPNLLIIDAHLPDTDGITLLHDVRAQCPALADVPAVMFTADAMAEQVEASRAAGFADHWTKPMDTARIVAAMRSLLALASEPARNSSH